MLAIALFSNGMTGEASLTLGLGFTDTGCGFAGISQSAGFAAENNSTADPKQRNIMLVWNERFLPIITYGY